MKIGAVVARGGFAAIFFILKAGLLNIDFRPVALRKIPGAWGLFAGLRRGVTEPALC